MNEVISIENVWLIFLITIKVICSFHIVMNKHEQPVSAVLWLAYIQIFPNITGVVLYLVFGINRIPRRTPKVENTSQKIKQLHSTPSGSLFSYLKFLLKFQATLSSSEKYSHILDKLLPEAPLVSGNSIELIRDGVELYPAMITAIKGAEHHIHLCSYIFLYDKDGKAIMDALEERAKAGVRVKVIFDHVGSEPFSNAIKIRRLDKRVPNLEVKPFTIFNLFAPYRIQLRNHRKVLIVDGETAFVGGINISAENSKKSGEDAIHDLHCKVEGPVVGQFQFVFLRDWCDVAKVSPAQLFTENCYFPKPVKKGDNLIRVSSSGPGQNHEATHKVFLTAVNSAEKRVWIMTPYFVPDQALIASLKMAAARGVDIKIVVPAKTDHWLVQNASRSFYGTLLKHGVRIFEREGCFNHSKAMVVDGKWSFMGSSNCDSRSFRLNYELDFICEVGPFNELLHRQIYLEVQSSKEIQLHDYRNRGVLTKFKENLSSLFTPVL